MYEVLAVHFSLIWYVVTDKITKMANDSEAMREDNIIYPN